MNDNKWAIVALSGLMALAGCNSGGGGDSAPQGTTTTGNTQTPSAASKVGVFLDSPVQGLKVVRADGSSAATGRWGEFVYADGETLTFYLGNLRLGSTKGKPEITPLDLFGVNNTADRRVTNLLRLLQSLDINDNPTDGIQLTVAAVDAASVRLDQDPGAFEKDVSVSTLLAKKRPGLTLVGQTNAQAHFDNTRTVASKVGWWSGSLTFDGKQYAIQGLAGVSSDFSGTYKAANGKSYSVLINGTGSKSQITVTTYTTLANGAFLPNVQNESGNLQQNEQNWIFTGTSGTRLEIAKTNPAAYVGTIGYYGVNASASANLCPNGGFTLQPGPDAGIPAVIYIGMAYLDTTGLRYAIKPLLSIGGDSVYSGTLTISNDKLQFALPGGTLSIARSSMPGLGLPSCN